MRPSQQGPLNLGRAAKIAGATYLITTATSLAGLFVRSPLIVFPVVASQTASFVIRGERVGTTGFLEDLREARIQVGSRRSPEG